MADNFSSGFSFLMCRSLFYLDNAEISGHCRKTNGVRRKATSSNFIFQM